MRAHTNVVGKLEPWDASWQHEIQIGAVLVSKQVEIGDPVHPDQLGFFDVKLPASDELERLLLAGEVALAAFTKKRQLIGLRTLKVTKPQALIAVRLPVQ